MRWLVKLCRTLHVAASSKGVYGQHQRLYLKFCESFGLDPLDVTEEDLCAAVCHFALGHTVGSVDSYLSALQNLFDAEGLGPLPRGPALRLTIRGLKRLFGPADVVVRARALTMDDLRRLVAAADPTDPDDVCFVAMLLTAFFLCLRTSEYTNGALRWGDVYPREDGGVSFWMPPVKRSAARLVTAAARADELDVLSWLKKLAGFVPLSHRRDHCPVFVSFAATRAGGRGYWAASRSSFIIKLKSAVRRTLGVSPVLFSGYSLRRGGVSALISAGVPLPVLNSHVGWAAGSAMQFTYFDASAPGRSAAATAALA